ncbi:putative quinol monooxygenase [Pseudoruegeria sp. HB172150]|uniref:putative quinol monooxygenase n=1 Tax=Pseudoruegeria sp. HB172150 TaxID=2721164 RepID=UPI0015527E20|nr:antibiotic biosynthesis monooxygenase [Pseudoruegeria sp. HB172150]
MFELSGYIRCRNETETERVRLLVAEHVRLTRAEPGCLSCDIVETDDPLVWLVVERFKDRAAFDLHQVRALKSDWGTATKGIVRDYHLREEVGV